MLLLKQQEVEVPEAEPFDVYVMGLGQASNIMALRLVQAARGDLVIGFEIDEYTKYRLLNGLDDISMTLQHDDEIGAYEATRPGFKPKTLPVRTADTVS